jgi:hypothetical protein
VSRCVWSRNLVNEEALTHWGLLCQQSTTQPINTIHEHLVSWIGFLPRTLYKCFSRAKRRVNRYSSTNLTEDNTASIFRVGQVEGKKLKKLKVARRGLYSTAALYIADCALAPNDVVPSFISRGATTPSGAGALYERRKEILSKEFSSQFVIHCNCAKLGHGTDYLTSPPKEGMLNIFIYRKIQRLRPGLNPRTREPEASMRTSRPPKPSKWRETCSQREFIKWKLTVR